MKWSRANKEKTRSKKTGLRQREDSGAGPSNSPALGREEGPNKWVSTPGGSQITTSLNYD